MQNYWIFYWKFRKYLYDFFSWILLSFQKCKKKRYNHFFDLLILDFFFQITKKISSYLFLYFQFRCKIFKKLLKNNRYSKIFLIIFHSIKEICKSKNENIFQTYSLYIWNLYFFQKIDLFALIFWNLLRFFWPHLNNYLYS